MKKDEKFKEKLDRWIAKHQHEIGWICLIITSLIIIGIIITQTI